MALDACFAANMVVAAVVGVVGAGAASAPCLQLGGAA
jgi:hypothetical protein